MAATTWKDPEVALIAMPWAIFNRPSIQLGTLKAYAEQVSDIKTTCFHPYLQIAKAIGIDNYTRIADSGWAGEALFSALLFPNMEEKAHTLFKGSFGRQVKQLPSFAMLQQLLQESCTSWYESIDWNTFTAVGFTLCFNQLLASLYMAKELKKFSGCPPIVFGGSSCVGSLGQSLLEHFPQIDYIIDGEGEVPFVSLCSYLKNSTNKFPDRTYCRTLLTQTKSSPEIKDLNNLPTPDYSPYFSQMQEIFPGQPFIPEIPIEFSRGCWWNKCTFCNLNLQWQGYRSKNYQKMFREITDLAVKHQCLDFTFTDNALPPKETIPLAELLSSHPADFHFFAEIRATTSSETLHEYKQMGVNSIQVGIEAIAPTLLAKFRKGICVIENIAIMKHAMANNIHLDGNLIIEFPGSTEQEVQETFHNLDYILPFKPLKTAVFFLGFGSPVYKSPDTYNIKGIFTHRKNKSLFPKSYLNKLKLLVNEYKGDRNYQRKLWRPVIEKVAQWHNFHTKREDREVKPLTYREGLGFIIIRQEQPDAVTLQHRLQGSSRQIYLFCNKIRTNDEIFEQFSNLKKNSILTFIDQLCQKHLMFREHDKVLSLAISSVFKQKKSHRII